MGAQTAPFRRVLIVLALLASVPLCCCRTSLAFSLLTGGGSVGSCAATVATAAAPCCAAHAASQDANPSSSDDGNGREPSSCTAPCCLKGFTPNPEIELPSADLLAFILPIALEGVETAIHDNGALTPQWELDGDPPPEYLGDRTLLRQGCLLLI